MYHVAIATRPESPTIITVGVANVHVDLFGVVEQLRQEGIRQVRVAADNPMPGSPEAIRAAVVDRLLYELGFDVVADGDDDLPNGQGGVE